MLHTDLPTRDEIVSLSTERQYPSVSIYIATTPVTEDTQANRIELKNLVGEAMRQLREADTKKREIWPIEADIDALLEDDEFWAYQANSLAIFATPERMRTYRLPNKLESGVHVSDRFHLKPMLRAVTFPHNAYVLVLAEGGVKLVEINSDLPPHEVTVPGMPKDAASEIGRSRVPSSTVGMASRDAGSPTSLLTRYARAVDHALRPVLSGHTRPLVLAAAEPMASLFRSVNTYPNLAAGMIAGNAERMADGELAQRARAVLDEVYAGEIAAFGELYALREAQGRGTTDIAQAARAATFGAIDTLIVDIDGVVPGLVDEETGAVSFAEEDDAIVYGVIDEITSRAMRTGARIIAARREDVPGKGDLAAVLRYPA